MIVATAVLFLIAGLLCIFKPGIIGMFDGFRIKPSDNPCYLKYIKLVGIGFVIGGMVFVLFALNGFHSPARPMDLRSFGLTDNKIGKNNDEDSKLTVQDYFPKRTMKKHFSGGFENEGFTHTIDRFDKDKIQVKQFDTGTGVILVYQVTSKEIRLIYSREVPDGSFKENYLDELKNNTDKVILKTPLKVGTTWTDSEGGEHRITGINVRVKTPAGTFNAIEVTFQSGNFEMKSYYAKDIGLVKRSTKGYGEDVLLKIQ
ncbi:MAG: hypothetical protein N2484_08720 [Clostridia bacterium]|nr:hypothetical protein [Clostridia bacterium]